jgi:hypothetical protein
MQPSHHMGWRVYTKRLISANGVSMRWFWSVELPHGTLESASGFSSRNECEADALRHGCRPEEKENERRILLGRLLSGEDIHKHRGEGATPQPSETRPANAASEW